MKKYNIYNLYVLKVNGHSFICKYNELTNTYVEIFTKVIIENNDNIIVESLSDYYSIFAQCNYATGKPLMLSKKELLRKYIMINGGDNLEKGKTLSRERCLVHAKNSYLKN